MKELRLERDPIKHTAVLRMDRKPVNALSMTMWSAFGEIAADLREDAETRAVVIWGGYEVFSVGADINDLGSLRTEEFEAANRILQRSFQAIATLPQITIAAINGYALGGGLELALAADFRYVAEDARLGLPEIGLGLMPGSGGTQRLPRLIGSVRAKELILRGGHIDARRALAIGLANEVFEPHEVYEVACAQAEEFAAGPYALRLAKRAIEEGVDRTLTAGLDLEGELIAQCFKSGDATLGLQSFTSKSGEPVRFKGE